MATVYNTVKNNSNKNYAKPLLSGAKIKKIRKSKGLTQRDVANAVMIGQGHYSRIESDKQPGTAAVIAAGIANVLGVRMERLFEERVNGSTRARPTRR